MAKWLNGLIKLFLFLLPWQTIYIYREIFIGGFKSEYATLGFYATEMLLWVIVVMFMIWYWKKMKLEIGNWKLGWRLTSDRVFVLSVLLFISYLFISILWSADTYLAWQQATRIMEAFLLFFVLFLSPLNFKSAVKWLVAGAILPCVLGIWQFISQSAPASTLLGLTGHAGWEGGASIISGDKLGRILRAYGTFSHPNVFGGYLVIVIALWLSLRGGARATTKQSLGDLEKTKDINLSEIASSADANRLPRNDIFIYCLLVTVLFVTFSRSALLALPVVWLIYFLVIKNSLLEKIKKLSFLIFPALLLVMILIPILSVRMSNESLYETRSINERVSGYSEAWQIIKAHPVLGVGAGNYTIALRETNPNRQIWEIQPVHNVFLLILAELGVVGIGLWLFMIICYFKFSDLIFVKYLFNICLIFVLGSFDHYLYFSYVGLALTAVFFGLLAKSDAQDSHS